MRLPWIILILSVCPALAAASDPVWPSVVEGFHLSPASAKKAALTEAVRQVTEYLQRLDPPLIEWKPTEEYVQEKLLAGPGSPGPDVSIDATQQAKTWILRLKPPDLAEFRRLNQQALEHRWHSERSIQAQDRLGLAGWVFLAITVLLASAASFRLRASGERKPPLSWDD